MSTKPVTIAPAVSLQDAARIMREKDIGSVVVKDNNELLGILTEWDFVHTAIAQGIDTASAEVQDIMVKDLVTVHPRMDVFDALRLMRDADIRHLPVIEEGRLVGFVTLKDILKIQPQLFEIIADKYELQRGGEEF